MEENLEKLKTKKEKIEKNINFFKQKISEVEKQDIEEKNKLTLPFQKQIDKSEDVLNKINEKIEQLKNQMKNTVQESQTETTPLLQEHINGINNEQNPIEQSKCFQCCVII